MPRAWAPQRLRAKALGREPLAAQPRKWLLRSEVKRARSWSVFVQTQKHPRPPPRRDSKKRETVFVSLFIFLSLSSSWRSSLSFLCPSFSLYLFVLARSGSWPGPWPAPAPPRLLALSPTAATKRSKREKSRPRQELFASLGLLASWPLP